MLFVFFAFVLFLVACVCAGFASLSPKSYAIIVVMILFGIQIVGFKPQNGMNDQIENTKDFFVQNILSDKDQIFYNNEKCQVTSQPDSTEHPNFKTDLESHQVCILKTEYQSIQQQLLSETSRVASLKEENFQLQSEREALKKEVLDLQNKITSHNVEMKQKVWSEMTDRAYQDVINFWYSILRSITSYQAIYFWMFVYSMLFSMIYTKRTFVDHHK